MADILLQGTTYQSVPYVDIPTTSSGTARFHEDVLKMGVMRNDAELVKTWTHDSLFVTDDKGTLPAYSTSATTIKAAANLSTTYSLTLADYNYYVLIRALTIPVYDSSTKEKSLNDYSLYSGCYEIVEFPANTFHSLDGSKTYASRITVALSGGALYRMVYWTSATDISVYTSSTYGIHQVAAAPSISSNKLTVKNPTLQFRGSSTYLTSSVYSRLTDIRVQYVIECYRAPKNHLNLNGWGLYQNGMQIVGCAETASHTLS